MIRATGSERAAVDISPSKVMVVILYWFFIKGFPSYRIRLIVNP
jgi:hypothetical protein